MKKCIGVFLIVFASFAQAQDANFLNSNQSLVNFNPSYAGSNGGIRNQFSYRNQWPSLNGNYTSVLNSVDAFVKPLKAGIAFSYLKDNAAGLALVSSHYGITYAQHITLVDKKLIIIPSFQCSYGQKSMDLSALNFGDSIYTQGGFVKVNQELIGNSTKSYIDMSSGFLVNYKSSWSAGAYFFHVNQPDVGVIGSSTLPYRMLLHASYNWIIKGNTLVQFTYRFERQSNFNFSQFGANTVLFGHLLAGLGYRSYDAAFANLGYRTTYFSLLAGYDITTSKLAGNTAGSWELHAAFFLRDKEHRKTLTSFETW